MADLEDVKARLLAEIDQVLRARPGASKRIMELCRAYESLAGAPTPGARGAQPG